MQKHRDSWLSVFWRHRPAICRLLLATAVLAISAVAVLTTQDAGTFRVNRFKGGRGFLFDLAHGRTAAYVANVTTTTLAPEAITIPKSCFAQAAMHINDDRDCYLEMASLYEAEVKAQPLAPYCFGSSGGPSPLVFQTLMMSEVPASFELLTASFLATQCCDAELWVWLTPAAYAAMANHHSQPPVPAGHDHRVIYKALDVAGVFASMRDDFPDVNDTAAAAMQDFADIRFQANWARVLLLYKYGGLYVDVDTMFLRDFRPLLAIPALSYREGNGIGLNIAVLKLHQRPHQLTRDFIAQAANTHQSRQSALSRILALWDSNSKYYGSLQYMSLPLFDFMWLRFLGFLARHNKNENPVVAAQTLELSKIHPEFALQKHWDHFFEPVSPTLAEARSTQFFLPGSFSYHWHNRYNLGIPANSWASVLNDRFRRMALLKSCPAPPPAAAAGSKSI